MQFSDLESVAQQTGFHTHTQHWFQRGREAKDVRLKWLQRGEVLVVKRPGSVAGTFHVLTFPSFQLLQVAPEELAKHRRKSSLISYLANTHPHTSKHTRTDTSGESREDYG